MSGGHPSAFDLGAIDRLGQGASPIHRLDARAKLLATFAFIVAVVSADKYAVGDLLPFFVFPIVVASLGGVPTGFVVRRILVIAPFAVLVGIFNPFLDDTVALTVAGVAVSRGWLSFASILLRFALTVGALLILVATTGVPSLGRAAERLGAPRAFVQQLLSLYRYLFLTMDEAARTIRAYRLRAVDRTRPDWRTFARILGQLLLRAVARARRVYDAMLSRGFDGEIRMLGGLRFTARDWTFLLGWLAAFALLRFAHPARHIGDLLLGGVS